MIVYFSGTGNSKFVADRLAELTNDAVCNSSDYIRKGNRATFAKPGTCIFVMPVYAAAPPLVFLDFIRNSAFPGNT